MNGDRKNSDLPLVRASVLGPIVSALRDSGVDPVDVLDPFGLNELQIASPDTFLSHDTIYAVFNAVARVTRPDFCARVGQTVDLSRFLPKGSHLSEALTLGDFFARFTQIASKESNAVSMSLLIEGEHAYFNAKRHFQPEVSPAQSDGFMAGIWITLLHRLLDFRWDPSSIILRINAPAVLPEIFHGVRGIPCDPRGFSIRFPSVWLNHRMSPDILQNRTGMPVADSDSTAPVGFLAGFEALVRPRLSDPAFTVDEAAKLAGSHPNTLNTRLSAYGETASQVIARLKKEKAESLLGPEGASVNETAQQLGYSDATAFSRAFRKWTGLSPTAYRRTYREDHS